MTRYERIKSMTIEEMAEFISTRNGICDLCANSECCAITCNCQRDIQRWLEEADDEAE